MRFRFPLVLLVLLVVAPMARADQPPYPVCAPAATFTWRLGTTAVYATSPYVVALNATAIEAWTKTTLDGGLGGTWVRTPVRGGDRSFVTVSAVLGSQTISVGFRTPANCLAAEERRLDGRFRAHLDRLRVGVKAGTLRVWGYRAGRDCHSLGGGAFVWKVPVNGTTRRFSYANACGPLDRRGRPTKRTVIRSRFYTVRIGTASSSVAAPASYLELTPAHPRTSGSVRVKIWAERIERSATATTHVQLVPLKLTVTVDYRPGRTPTWRTAVRVGW